MKFTALVLSIALLATQSNLALGTKDCPVDKCPDLKDGFLVCFGCNTSDECARDGWCEVGDMKCGCVAYHKNYCGKANCNQFTRFIDGGQSPQGTFTSGPQYVMIQGKSSRTGKTLCWEVRGGSTRLANKIVLGQCEGMDRHLFNINVYPNEQGMPVASIFPKIDPEMVVVGVRESMNKAWLRLERPSFVPDETQTFYVKDNDMVGLGNPDCSGEGCLMVTNQGKNTDKGDAVMLRTEKELERFVKHGDVIETWSFV